LWERIVAVVGVEVGHNLPTHGDLGAVDLEEHTPPSDITSSHLVVAAAHELAGGPGEVKEVVDAGVSRQTSCSTAPTRRQSPLLLDSNGERVLPENSMAGPKATSAVVVETWNE